MSLTIKIGVVRCPECKEEVHRDAKLCPHCRTQLSEHSGWQEMKANRGSCLLLLVIPALPLAATAAWLTQVS